VEEKTGKKDEDLPASSQLSPGNLTQDIRKRAMPHQASPRPPSSAEYHAASPPLASTAGNPSRTSLQKQESNVDLCSYDFPKTGSEIKMLVEQIREKRKAEDREKRKAEEVYQCDWI
jgi:hypothetical protein